jgi:two-component system response regulator
MEPIKILMLEDVDFDAVLTERELKRAKFNFILKRVEEELEFRTELKEFTPDLILADHSLPHFDGVSALQIVKIEYPDIPYIFVSGKIGEEFAVELLKDGATDYVLKTNLPKIGHAVQRALEEYKEKLERKLAENALRRSEEQFRAVAESAVDIIITTDINGSIVFFNNSLTKIFGYTQGELNGKNLTHLLPDRSKKYYLNELQKFKESGQHEFMGKLVTITGLKKDGTEFPFEMSLAAWISEEKTYLTSIIRDLTERQKTEKQIKKSLHEKEVLINEIHHRVKNNMQIISSLLNLQTHFASDIKTVNILKETQNRVKSMAIVHEKLYQSPDLTHINFYNYIVSLVTHLFDSYGITKSQIKKVIDVQYINLNIDTAVPCGLIICEIVSNSLKYAFKEGRIGKVTVSLKIKEEKFHLTISDDGIGFPEEIDFKKTDSLGLQLVNSLTNQIDGEIQLDKTNGTKFNITFKELEYNKI